MLVTVGDRECQERCARNYRDNSFLHDCHQGLSPSPITNFKGHPCVRYEAVCLTGRAEQNRSCVCIVSLRLVRLFWYSAVV